VQIPDTTIAGPAGDIPVPTYRAHAVPAPADCSDGEPLALTARRCPSVATTRPSSRPGWPVVGAAGAMERVDRRGLPRSESGPVPWALCSA
jgi:hypothetical protein